MALELGKKANDSRIGAWLGVSARRGGEQASVIRRLQQVGLFLCMYLSKDPLTTSAASSLMNMISYLYSGNTLIPQIQVSALGTVHAFTGRRPMPHGAHHQLKQSRQGSFIISIVELGNSST